MNALLEAFAWLFDPAHFGGSDGIAVRLGEHLLYSAVTLLIAGAIALPLGLAIGHSGRGKVIGLQLAGALRALPTLGIVLVLALVTTIGIWPALIALVVLALPPLLAAASSALQAVDRATIDAARAVGMTGWQVLWKVEIPLGLPIIMGGIRSAALQVIATWTVAAVLPLGGLGRFIIDGLAVQDYAQMLAGSILVILLALLVDGIFAAVQRLVVPRGVSAGRVTVVRTGRGRPRTATSGPVA